MPTPRTCYAFGCTPVVEPEHPMCPTHWALVPPDIQQLVRRQWRRGRADEPWPRYEWQAALDVAILAGARAEGRLGEPRRYANRALGPLDRPVCTMGRRWARGELRLLGHCPARPVAVSSRSAS